MEQSLGHPWRFLLHLGHSWRFLLEKGRKLAPNIRVFRNLGLVTILLLLPNILYVGSVSFLISHKSFINFFKSFTILFTTDLSLLRRLDNTVAPCSFQSLVCCLIIDNYSLITLVLSSCIWFNNSNLLDHGRISHI